MKKILFLALTLVLTLVSTSYAYVSVKGYYRSNGTYVAPHVRSNPNGLKSDNYSYTPSQGAYNKTYGTRGAEWDTSTKITDPYYYEGKALYDAGKSSSSLNTSPKSYSSLYTSKVLPAKDVSYVTKLWVDANPAAPCSQSTFLRIKEKTECETYKKYKSSYTWNVTTNEFDGKHYIYNSETKVTNSCPDGYYYAAITKNCLTENIATTSQFPLQAGCSSTYGFSVTTGKSCSSGITCAPGLTFNGQMCVK